VCIAHAPPRPRSELFRSQLDLWETAGLILIQNSVKNAHTIKFSNQTLDT